LAERALLDRGGAGKRRTDGDRHFAESVRLARLVGELGVPADVVVASEDHVREWGELSGTMIHDALAEGKAVGGRAA
jgi:hypothetical protein